MELWKFEVYQNKDDPTPNRWGVMIANTEEEVAEKVIENMGGAERTDMYTVAISRIPSLPEGTFFWSSI